jgi:hypothetical protein
VTDRAALHLIVALLCGVAAVLLHATGGWASFAAGVAGGLLGLAISEEWRARVERRRAEAYRREHRGSGW